MCVIAVTTSSRYKVILLTVVPMIIMVIVLLTWYYTPFYNTQNLDPVFAVLQIMSQWVEINIPLYT